MLRLCYNNQTAFNRTQCLNVFRCCTPLDCYGYSTLAEPVGTSNPPRKSRRWTRKFLLATLFTTVSAAGLLYTSQYFRGLLTDRYPKAAPILNRVKNFLGGWYDEPDALLSTSSTGDAFLPSFYEDKSSDEDHHPSVTSTETSAPTHPTEYSDASSLPTVEDVVKMTQERSRRVISPKTLHDTENEMAEATRAVRAAMRSLAELEGATRNHIDGLRDAIKAPDSSKTKEKMWDQVSHLSALKDKAETKANAAVEEATKRLGALRESINQHKLNDESLEAEWLPKGLKAHGTLQYDLSGSIYEVRKLQNELHMLMRYRDLISKTHGTLQKDLHSIWESTDLNKLSKDASSLSVGELNSLIVVAHNRIGQLQAMLADAEERENARLNSALEAQRRADEGLIVDYVNRELERERNAHELDRLRWEAEAREATQRELQVALARHSENLAQMLSFNKSEMEHQFAYRMREALAQERTAFEAALSGWTKRMEAIEDVIDGRTELDRISKETQALWIACEALASNLSSTSPTIIEHSSQPGATFTGPLKDFLEAIEESASTGDYPFAMSILQQIPSEVSQNGVWLERGLKERFEKVYRVCRRVALVDETGGSLYTYALSWLQSILIFDVFPRKYLDRIPWLKSAVFQPLLVADSEVPEGVDGKPVELDTFHLLQSARAALNRDSNDSSDISTNTLPVDDLELAVRLLGCLRGQARLVAADWLQDARLYLETRQAAQALLAYAAARGMSTFHNRL